jgi:asparaginyl-tRNA synthetase
MAGEGWLGRRTHTAREALSAGEGEYVRLLGWAAWRSDVGGVSFIHLRDGTGYIQVAGKAGETPEPVLKALKEVSLESAIYVGGRVRRDPRAPGGAEVLVEELEVVAPADPWPITKSALKSPGFLFDKRHLSLRGRRSIAAMKIRAELIYGAFEFFTSRGFTLISAPTLVQAACEGGATLFPIEYFGEEAYLSQSAQFYEEAAICALEKVFIFQPAFRAEKSRTTKHLTEFWMIEAEVAFATQEDNLRLQEELLAHISRRIYERCREELATLGRRFEPPEPPFTRLTYTEVHEICEQKGIRFAWGDDIPTEAERYISQSFDQPFFITDYPLSARSFYHQTRQEDPRITLSADLMAPEGYGEIATGGQRIDSYSLLLERIRGQELPPESFTWYLELRRFGMPPHAGFGLGVERTTRWIAGLKHIREAALFPRTPARVYP